MDYLREGIHLRGFAQIDPLVAYKNEGFDMFTSLINMIWEEFARYIFHVEVEVDDQSNGGGWPLGGGATSSTGRRRSGYQYAGGTAADQPSALAAARAGAVPAGIADAAEYAADSLADMPAQVETRRVADEERIGRNDPCPCGSGKKYKKCHGA
jgi:preprotein translocase subunit SecA